VAELVDARDLKSPGATEITHLSDLTRAGNPHEAGGGPAGLSNTPPPLPLAGRPSKTWADVFLPTAINRRKDRCRLLQSPPIFSRNPSLLIQVLAPSISVGGEQQGGWRLPSEGKGHTFESCRVRQFFFVSQRAMRARTKTPVLSHSNE